MALFSHRLVIYPLASKWLILVGHDQPLRKATLSGINGLTNVQSLAQLLYTAAGRLQFIKVRT